MNIQKTEQIYLASPVWLQNTLVSIYGFLEHRRRYGLEYRALQSRLKNNEYKSLDQLKPKIDKKLNEILEIALMNVPYYRNLNLPSPRLCEFPLLDRDTVSQNTEELINEKYNKKKLIKLYTGGSTGKALKIYMTKRARQESYSFWAIFYERMGFRIGESKASLVGRKIQMPNNDRPPFWRYNFTDKQLLFSSYHLTENNISLYIKKLNNFKPKIIEGYPQSILRLAEHILKSKENIDFTLSGISTSSEHFTDAQRETIENAFNSKVYDQYGSAESVIFASECKFGTMHIEPEYGVVEILTSDGEIRPEGSGELIVTTLLNDAMPLIRYKIGDLGRIGSEHCKCGRNTVVLKNFYGKVGSIIVCGNKQIPTAAIALAFKYSKGLNNAQVVQNEASKITVKLVTKPDFNIDSEKSILSELNRMLGDSIAIDLEYVNEIPPGDNGKYQLVVQNYLNT